MLDEPSFSFVPSAGRHLRIMSNPIFGSEGFVAKAAIPGQRVAVAFSPSSQTCVLNYMLKSRTRSLAD
jgi:hypothetical protein